MKKLLVMIGSAAVALGASAATVTIDGVTWTYTASGSNATLGGGTTSSPAMPTSTAIDASLIPWTFTVDDTTYTVTAIAAYAFKNCKALTGTLTIPDSVTAIGGHAFENCEGLTGTLTIPAGVTVFEDLIFNCCYNLTGFSYSGTVTSIGNRVFKPNSKMVGVYPDMSAVTSLGEEAFSGVPFTGDFPSLDSLTTIPRYGFSGCNFTSATIPAHITVVGANSNYGVFETCTNMQAILVKGRESDSSKTTVYCGKFAASCPKLELVVMGANTSGSRTTQTGSNAMLYGDSNVDVLLPANGYWDSLVLGGNSSNQKWYYGPGKEFDLAIDDTVATATFTPVTENALTNALVWAAKFKEHFGLDTVISITNTIETSAAAVEIMEDALEGITLNAPSWYLTFQVKTQAQLNRVLAAVSGPIVADITGATEEINVPAGRQVAVLVPGGAAFNYHKRGLIISFH